MKAYQSILSLDAKACKALRLSDPYSVHRIVYDLLYGKDKSKKKEIESRVLYADLGGDFLGRTIVIRSQRPPVIAADGFGTLRCVKVEDSLLRFPAYEFRITVNPVARRGDTQVVRTDREAIMQWFVHKCVAHGIRIIEKNSHADRIGMLNFLSKDGQKVTICQAQLSGILEVTDAELFAKAYLNGIGRAKAFGCGMIMIKPLQTLEE